MIVGQDGYAINYEPAQNRITILLPQTDETLTNTVTPVAKRKTNLTAHDLRIILWIAEWVCEGRDET